MRAIETIVAWGPSGLLLAAILDGAGLPMPGGVDALITFLASQRPTQIYWLVAVCTLGSVMGNFILFLLARRGGQAFLDKRSSSRRMQRFRKWFERYGLLTVFVSALIPLPIMPMKIFVLSSGALGSSPGAFLVAFLGARIPRYLGLAFLGRSMGSDAGGYLRAHVWQLAGFALLLFAVLAVLVKLADRTPQEIKP